MTPFKALGIFIICLNVICMFNGAGVITLFNFAAAIVLSIVLVVNWDDLP